MHQKWLIVAFLLIVVAIASSFIVSNTRTKSSDASEALLQAPLSPSASSIESKTPLQAPLHTSTSSAVSAAKKNICPFGSVMVTPARASAAGAFTSAITSIGSIAVISPGKLVGDSRFTYLWNKDGQRVPVFAPADGTLVKISYKTRADVAPGMSTPDYDLVFLVDCHTLYRINHITDPTSEIANLKPIREPLQIGNGYPAPSEAQTTPIKYSMVKAGQQIGTTVGTPAAHNWDFGIFVDHMAVCPYEQFPEPIRSAWLALFGNAKIDMKPMADVMCDVSGTF